MASKVMVTTESMRELLEKNGIENTEIWSRGVDTGKYKKNEKVTMRTIF
jgi:hypothetical protein